MTRLRKIVAAVSVTAVAALATAAGVERGAGSGTGRSVEPTTRPLRAPMASQATQSLPPVSLLAPRPISDSCSILLRRSIFAKDHRASDWHGDVPIHPNAPRESKLIFLGAMKEGTRYIASIEDTDAKRPMWIREGDKLSEGTQVREITLDHLIVEKNGARRRVEVGASMEGTPVSLAESPTPAAPVTLPSRTPSVTASTAGTATEDSLEEMMRRRRIQELER